LEGADQGVKSGEAVFASGGQVATQGAKSLSDTQGAKSAGDFLLEFDHANVAFGQIIIKGDAKIVHEGEHGLLTVA